MPKKLQTTGLQKTIGLALQSLETWGINPWRRYSLLLIVFLAFFLVGSSLGMINGVLALMDPIGAFFTVLLIELMIRLRRIWSYSTKNSLALQMIDMARIGLLYGLFMEGFKLL